MKLQENAVELRRTRADSDWLKTAVMLEEHGVALVVGTGGAVIVHPAVVATIFVVVCTSCFVDV